MNKRSKEGKNRMNLSVQVCSAENSLSPGVAPLLPIQCACLFSCAHRPLPSLLSVEACLGSHKVRKPWKIWLGCHGRSERKFMRPSKIMKEAEDVPKHNSLLLSFLFFKCIHCRSGVQTLPHSAKVHYNYANFLKDEGRDREAIYHYRTALRWAPTTVRRPLVRSLPSQCALAPLQGGVRILDSPSFGSVFQSAVNVVTLPCFWFLVFSCKFPLLPATQWRDTQSSTLMQANRIGC